MSWQIVRTDHGTYRTRAKPGHPGVQEQEWLSGGSSITRVGGSRVVVDERAPAVRRLRRAPVEVLLTPEAREAILHRAIWETGQDGLETGGGLFGINAGDRVLITHANGPGHRATRTATSVGFDTSALEHWATINEEVSRIGCWHTHPTGSSGRPSMAATAATFLPGGPASAGSTATVGSRITWV